MMEQLRSRKFWVTVATSVFVAAAGSFGVELDPENLTALLTVVASYLVGQSAVDMAKAKAEVNARVPELNQLVRTLAEMLENAQADVPGVPEPPNTDPVDAIGSDSYL